jgi:hypothetical protein
MAKWMLGLFAFGKKYSSLGLSSFGCEGEKSGLIDGSFPPNKKKQLGLKLIDSMMFIIKALLLIALVPFLTSGKLFSSFI